MNDPIASSLRIYSINLVDSNFKIQSNSTYLCFLLNFKVQDLCFINGEQFVTCNDLVCKDSADRNIMAWDFQSGVVLSNQIYQVN